MTFVFFKFIRANKPLNAVNTVQSASREEGPLWDVKGTRNIICNVCKRNVHARGDCCRYSRCSCRCCIFRADADAFFFFPSLHCEEMIKCNCNRSRLSPNLHAGATRRARRRPNLLEHRQHSNNKYLGSRTALLHRQGWCYNTLADGARSE